MPESSTYAVSAGWGSLRIQRTSDGPWEHIGQQVPREQVIAQKFAAGGEAALLKLLGAPLAKSAEETIWVYESRRESLQVWCDPPEKVRKYGQAFTIVSVTYRGERPVCEIEGKEFISDSILAPEVAIKQARAPLGFDLRQCGAAAKNP